MKQALVPADMLTIEGVMSELGVSRTTVLGLGKSGYLHPVKLNGRLHYQAAEVTAERERREASNKILSRPSRDLRPARATVPPTAPRSVPSYEGGIAARAVALFDEGRGVREIVRQLEISFELAKHLWAEYVSAGTEILLRKEHVEALRKKLDVPPVPSGEDIVKAVGRLASQVRDELAAIGVEREASERRPSVSRERRSGRVVVDIRRPIRRDDDDPDDGVQEWTSRSVDVTDVLQMTADEIECAFGEPASRSTATS